MKYCSQCGMTLILTIPEGDNRERHVCSGCQTIHYQNPKIVTGTLPVIGDKILLCRRAIEPRYGLWTLPAGFMENGESVLDAARRETWEEACTHTCREQLYMMISQPCINQVCMFYRAEIDTRYTEEPHFAAGQESLEVRLFDEQDIPWDKLAFPTITRTLELFFRDRINGKFPLREESL